jgi:hypothetical protein
VHEGKWFRSSPLYSLQYNTVRMSLRETISLLCFLSLFLFRMEINYTFRVLAVPWAIIGPSSRRPAFVCSVALELHLRTGVYVNTAAG